MKLEKSISKAVLAGLLLSAPLGVLAEQSTTKLSPKLEQKLSSTNNNESLTVFVYFRDKENNINAKLEATRANLSDAALKRRIINLGKGLN